MIATSILIQDYRQKKANKTVDLQAHGNGVVGVVTRTYDPTNGQRLPDSVVQENITTAEKIRDNLKINAEAANKYLAEAEAYVAELIKADAAFGKDAKAEKKENYE